MNSARFSRPTNRPKNRKTSMPRLRTRHDSAVTFSRNGALQAVGPDGVDPVQAADQRLRAVGLGRRAACGRAGRTGAGTSAAPARTRAARRRRPGRAASPARTCRRVAMTTSTPAENTVGIGRADALGEDGHVVTDPGEHVAPADLLDPRARHPEHRPDRAFPQPRQQVRAQPPDRGRSRPRWPPRRPARRRPSATPTVTRDRRVAPSTTPSTTRPSRSTGTHLERRPGHRGEHGGERSATGRSRQWPRTQRVASRPVAVRRTSPGPARCGDARDAVSVGCARIGRALLGRLDELVDRVRQGQQGALGHGGTDRRGPRCRAGRRPCRP